MVIGENNNKTILADSSFDSNQISNLHLSIELSSSSLSYCIIDTQKYRCLLLSSRKLETDNLLEIFSNDDYLSQNFKSKSISFVNFANTLVPYELFEKKDKENLFALNHELNDEVLLEDNLREEIINLHAVPKLFFQTIKNILPDAALRSQSSILINNFTNLNLKVETMFLYLKDSFVNIVVTKGKNLLFQNKFNYVTKEDLLFYVLFSIQELNFSNEDINTIVYGNVTEDEFSILYDYIRNIKYGNKLKDISCSNEFNSIENHCYSILYRQFLCV
tara:strand:- start:456 stop:1283 length:828 start_codon:yes stop_codon:yes gene_type:complete